MKRSSATLMTIVAWLAIVAPAPRAQNASTLQTLEYQVTFAPVDHGRPIVIKDSVGDAIVFSEYASSSNANIYYQRVGNGAPIGPAVTVADTPSHEILTDASGDNIIYTLFPCALFTAEPCEGAWGDIVVYQVSTAQSRQLTTGGNAKQARIFGDFVVWIERTPSGNQAVLYQLSSGSPVQTTVLAGPSPAVGDQVVIGDRFAAWWEYVNGVPTLKGYDRWTGAPVQIGNAARSNIAPSIGGSWIAYQSHASGEPGDEIRATNLLTGEERVVASNGAFNLGPHVSGDLVAYTSNVSGTFEVYLYRFGEGDTFQVTNTGSVFQVDILGNLVSYVDRRNGNLGVFASSLSFSSTTPPVFVPPVLPDVVVEATGPNGAPATFTIAATAGNGGAATVSCSPASGNLFALGTTDVGCTAIDSADSSLTASAHFNVIVRDTTAPVLTMPANIVADATTAAGTAVSYAVTALDLVDPAPGVTCSAASGSVFAIGTTTVTCAARDASGNVSPPATFTVLVKAAEQQVADLIGVVDVFNQTQGIPGGLDNKLQNAQAALAAAGTGSRPNVCQMLGAFINSTNAQAGKSLTIDQANQLVTAATRIRGVLACQ